MVLWLNLVLQPCAMAFSPSANEMPDCPNCPPAHEHSQHVQDVSPTDISSSKGLPCAADMSDCEVSGEANYDRRTDQLNLADYSNDFAPLLVATVLPAHEPQYAVTTKQLPSKEPPPGKPIPLNMLHCVYLN